MFVLLAWQTINWGSACSTSQSITNAYLLQSHNLYISKANIRKCTQLFYYEYTNISIYKHLHFLYDDYKEQEQDNTLKS